MIRNYEWVDYIFIQSAALYLGQDIIIVTTTSTENSPFLTISGNMADENIPCPGIALTIGSKSSVHYQSLLPLEVRGNKTQIKPGLPEHTIQCNFPNWIYDPEHRFLLKKLLKCRNVVVQNCYKIDYQILEFDTCTMLSDNCESLLSSDLDQDTLQLIVGKGYNINNIRLEYTRI